MRRVILRITFVLFALTAFTSPALCQRGVSGSRSGPRTSSSRSYVSYTPYHRPYYRNTRPLQDTDWIFLAVVFLGVPATVALGRGAYSLIRNRTAGWVRVISVPRGEAPLEVREAWIGVELPLRTFELEPGTVKSGSLLTPGGPVLDHGYAVAGAAAIRALEKHAPDAAAWWRTNAKYVLEPGYRLVFPEDVCERVTADHEP